MSMYHHEVIGGYLREISKPTLALLTAEDSAERIVKMVDGKWSYYAPTPSFNEGRDYKTAKGAKKRMDDWRQEPYNQNDRYHGIRWYCDMNPPECWREEGWRNDQWQDTLHYSGIVLDFSECLTADVWKDKFPIVAILQMAAEDLRNANPNSRQHLHVVGQAPEDKDGICIVELGYEKDLVVTWSATSADAIHMARCLSQIYRKQTIAVVDKSVLIEEGIQDALTRSPETESGALLAVARDVIACKIAGIVDGMEGIKKQHNQRYPAHSIDQVVSAVSPLVSASGLRIKTEVISIEPFALLADMPFWRDSNGRQEQYTRDVHLFRMKLLFTVIDGATGERDQHQWTHVFEIGRAEQDQACGSAISYAMKDFLKREFMIPDDSDDPDFKSRGNSDGQRINLQNLDGQLVPVISIEPNTRMRSDRSPGWFAKDETGRISIALWESSFKTIDMLLRWNSGTMLQILGENEARHRFSAPLVLRVKANQHGLNLAADGQLNTLKNPAVADKFMQIARNIIPGLTAEKAAEYLDVAQLAGFLAIGVAQFIRQLVRKLDQWRDELKDSLVCDSDITLAHKEGVMTAIRSMDHLIGEHDPMNLYEFYLEALNAIDNNGA